MPPGQVNVERQEFIAFRIRQNANPVRKKGSARDFYGRLYYRTDPDERAADAARERAFQAGQAGGGAGGPAAAAAPAAVAPPAVPPGAGPAPHAPARPPQAAAPPQIAPQQQPAQAGQNDEDAEEGEEGEEEQEDEVEQQQQQQQAPARGSGQLQSPVGARNNPIPLDSDESDSDKSITPLADRRASRNRQPAGGRPGLPPQGDPGFDVQGARDAEEFQFGRRIVGFDANGELRYASVDRYDSREADGSPIPPPDLGLRPVGAAGPVRRGALGRPRRALGPPRRPQQVAPNRPTVGGKDIFLVPAFSHNDSDDLPAGDQGLFAEYAGFAPADKVRARREGHLAEKAFPDEAGWEAHYLSSGGYGVVYVYVRKEDGRIMDRLVVKDTVVRPDSWVAFECWAGDVRDVDKRRHMEVDCLWAIEGAGGTKNILRILADKMYNDRQMYRMYSCLCPLGDMHNLLGRSLDSRAVVPEAFLWSVFTDLVNACLVLQYGAEDEKDADEDWKPIVHRDMKLLNVFVDNRHEDDTDFPAYPRARLGDFGMAIRTTETDGHNPISYAYGGTPGWQPPEQIRVRDGASLQILPGWKMSEKTNVWGVGAIIMRMMCREDNPTKPDYFKDKRRLEYGKDKPVWNDSAKGYSSTLQELVRSCMRYNPKKRPTLRHLQAEILRYTSGEDDLIHGMRSSTQANGADRLEMPRELDDYKLHFSARSSKRRRTR